MTRISFMGMGAMGSRMARRLLETGYEVCVWNRDPNRTAALVQAGASAAATPREAAVNADIVIAMVRDDGASQQVWCDPHDGAFAGMSPSAIGVDCSTLSVTWCRELHARAIARGANFVEAPVTGSRPQAEASRLMFFVGGSLPVFERVSPVLEAMAGSITYAGEAGSGAAVKLAINALFASQLLHLSEILSLFALSDVDPNRGVEILTSTPVCSPAVKLAASAMLEGQFEPMFPIDLVDKDLAYTLMTAEAGALTLPLTRVVRQQYQKANEQGFGADNITGIAQLYR